MCEWLSEAEWCDLRLLCGGRVLGAHRAVLASVSPFLRSLFLECPEDGFPTFLALPDFDVDALYSVLGYIYNGEVVVPALKLCCFVDVVRTLQIYVDDEFLHSISSICTADIDQLYLVNNKYRKWKLVKATYPQSKEEQGVFVTVKKDMFTFVETEVKTSLDLEDGVPRCNEFHDVGLPYSRSASHRQRQSVQRDSLVRSDPCGDWSNGPATGVPQMPSTDYRNYTSPLSFNADHHHVPPKAFFTAHYEANSHLKSPCLGKQSCIDYTNHERVNENHQFKYVQKSASKMNSSIDMSHSKDPFSNSVRIPNESRVTEVETRIESKVNNVNRSKHLKHNRFPIRNEVQNSPWSTQQPISYRPFRRKNLNPENHIMFLDIKNNDNNNNEVSNNETISKEELLQGRVPADAATTAADAATAATTAATATAATTAATATTTVVAAIAAESKCSACKQAFPDRQCLLSHSCPAPSRFSCTECGKSFSQLRNYKYHMSVHRGTKEFAASCPLCGKHFNDRGYLSSHMKIHRNRKEYKCPHCPKSFNQRVAYNMHVKIHTGVKPHACAECGKAFSRKMLLKQHLRTHSGERPYACAHCGKRFADRSNMTLHLRLHTGVKPFSCSICSKSFTKKHHLKSHLNFHTGAKPYSCPRCNTSFTQSSNMRTHLKKCKAEEKSS